MLAAKMSHGIFAGFRAMDKPISERAERDDQPASDALNFSAQATVIGGLAPWRLERVKQMIRADLGKKISVPMLAQACTLTRSHFSRAFKRSMGLSPQDWIRQQRIDQAKDLIRNSPLTLTQISAECGFCDQAHFSHMFSKTEGTNPASWRGQERRAASLRYRALQSRRHIWTLETNPSSSATASGSSPNASNPHVS
jgi:AraC-like DNA-binding protein